MIESMLRDHFGDAYMTVLLGDRADAQIMMTLAEVRQREDEIDEELRDPESAICMGYAVIAGERSVPTARYLLEAS